LSHSVRYSAGEDQRDKQQRKSAVKKIHLFPMRISTSERLEPAVPTGLRSILLTHPALRFTS
jgi:hypothetical protein